jgi:hypothetical protein
MRVVCISNKYYGDKIIVGKAYSVKKWRGNNIYPRWVLVDEEGVESAYPTEFFEDVKETRRKKIELIEFLNG